MQLKIWCLIFQSETIKVHSIDRNSQLNVIYSNTVTCCRYLLRNTHPRNRWSGAKVILQGTDVLGNGADSGHGLHMSSKALCVSGVGLAPAQSLCGNTREEEETTRSWCICRLWWLGTLPGLGDMPGRGEGLLRPGEPTPIGEWTEGKGLPTEPTGFAGEGAVNPDGLGMGCWLPGPEINMTNSSLQNCQYFESQYNSKLKILNNTDFKQNARVSVKVNSKKKNVKENNLRFKLLVQQTKIMLWSNTDTFGLVHKFKTVFY